MGHPDAQLHRTHVTVQVVFHHHAQLVAAGPQRHGLLVDRLVIHVSLEVVLRGVEHDAVFHRIDDAAAQRGELREDVHHGMHHAVLVLELQVAVSHLNRDWRQHALVRHANKIRPHIKR